MKHLNKDFFVFVFQQMIVEMIQFLFWDLLEWKKKIETFNYIINLIIGFSGWTESVQMMLC